MVNMTLLSSCLKVSGLSKTASFICQVVCERYVAILGNVILQQLEYSLIIVRGMVYQISCMV